MFVKEKQAAVGIAFVNSIGNIGGFAGPFIIGLGMNNFSGQIEISWMIVSVMLFAGCILLGTVNQ